jgi:TetR/AcrR family transcriptional regulator, cholesterol catabolism regulator
VKRREQAEWRREQLLDAALEVFVSKGIDRATVKDIAQAAGVTPGLLYHYFDSKDTLLATLLEERSFLSQLRRQLAGATDRAATVVLPEMVRAYRQVLTENRGLVSLFFSASSTNRHVRTAMGEFVAEGQRLLMDYLDARVAAGELRPHDTRLFAQTLLAAVAAGQHMGADTDPDQLVDLLINGTTTSAPRRAAIEHEKS